MASKPLGPWLATGAVVGAALPILGVVVIAAFNAFYWLPIRGELPAPEDGSGPNP